MTYSETAKMICLVKRRNCIMLLQSTPDNSNLQGKLQKLSGVCVIGSSKKIDESKVKNSFYCTVNI